ncbi:hypothetical protein SGPA1_30112 [Streptomyces misionensis JCM 4497]
MRDPFVGRSFAVRRDPPPAAVRHTGTRRADRRPRGKAVPHAPYDSSRPRGHRPAPRGLRHPHRLHREP